MNRMAQTTGTSTVRVSRWVHYRRQLERGDFSLEANTDSVPEGGFFYLLQAGSVLMCSDELDEVETAYRGLCREHWERHLGSEIPARRMESAWGLLGLEPDHAAASSVVESEGEDRDRKRLGQARNRYRWQKKQSAAAAKRAAP